MKFKISKKYIYSGITGFCVLAAAILFHYGISKLHILGDFLRTTGKVLAPIIYGFVIAYLLCPAVNFIENKLLGRLFRWFHIEIPAKSKRKTIVRMTSILLTLACTLFIVYQLLYMLIPELIRSITNMISSTPVYWTKLESLLGRLLKDNPSIEKGFLKYLDSGLTYLTKDLLPHVNEILMNFSIGIWDFVVVLKNLAIGCIVSVYILNSKEHFAASSKKALYAIFPYERVNLFMHNLRFIHTKFGGFIIGKIIDSFIIGCICFLAMTFMKMPYAVLISVIIGITNVIPFFGPFIGAIPSAFLILIVNPIQCIYFIIFILILQTFDGNILGPKILSESTDLTSFWIIFAILIGGGLFGMIGMFIAVPIFAVIYALVNAWIDHLLAKKNLSTDVEQYLDLKLIEKQKASSSSEESSTDENISYEFVYLNENRDEFKNLKLNKIKKTTAANHMEADMPKDDSDHKIIFKEDKKILENQIDEETDTIPDKNCEK